ncbi:MAG: lysophospholipid acyltransferase family protein [Alphaproteobacteria bacterium]
MKKLRYLIEAALCLLFFAIFKLLPVQWASAVGGFLGRSIGPHLAASRKAARNLQKALPDLAETQRAAIIKAMWDNLGRVFAEYPHLKTIAQKHLTIKNPHIFEHAKDTGAVFFAGHLANWELWSAMTHIHFNSVLDITYRAPNNPYIDKILHKARKIDGKLNAHPKSRESGRKLIQVLKNKGLLAIMIDQKYNEGEAVDFFGHPAMTNPVAFQLAQRFNVPLIPTSCVRTGGANFTITFHAPLSTHHKEGNKRPLDEMMREGNLMLEQWIKDNPAQWIWLHKRWDSKALKEEQ